MTVENTETQPRKQPQPQRKPKHRSDDHDGPCFASDSLVAVLDHVGFLVGEVSR